MHDFLTAKEARSIANKKNLSYVFHKISEAAYKCAISVQLNYQLDDSKVDVLREYGYEVTQMKVPIYEETPYGYTTAIIGYRNITNIEW